jgi:Transposase and inactivated derivatives
MKVIRHYDTDLTEKQWEIIKKLLPKQKTGRKPIDRRRIINAIFYLVRTGCQWRNLPREFPKWKTVYTVFRRWRIAGVWKEIHDALNRIMRKSKGKKPTPSVGIMDSQTAKTTESGGERGYDGGKKINGRKRHIMVDTLGLIMVVVVHTACIQDYDGAKLVLNAIGDQFKRLKVIFADSAYGKMGLPDWTKQCFGWILQTVLRPVGVKGFVILPKRWIVERTFAWISKYRRHSKDYERNPENSVAMIHIAMTARMLRHLQNRKVTV